MLSRMCFTIWLCKVCIRVRAFLCNLNFYASMVAFCADGLASGRLHPEAAPAICTSRAASIVSPVLPGDDTALDFDDAAPRQDGGPAHRGNVIQLFFRDAYFRGKVVWSVAALGVMITLFFLLIAKLAVIEGWVRDLHVSVELLLASFAAQRRSALDLLFLVRVVSAQVWSWSAVIESSKLAYFVYACGAQRYVGYIRRKIAMARRFSKVSADSRRRHYEMAMINYPVTLVETSVPRASSLHYLDSYCAESASGISHSSSSGNSSAGCRPLHFSIVSQSLPRFEFSRGNTTNAASLAAESPAACVVRRRNT